ncbi:glycosyltransferase [Sporolactobacillus sp. Y61]|uniref:Glycosyltransferase n=1 Tax=Sporolactobacillus sp. Y61 TaxID=3160863 RepID=A0AAU8IFQ7_9BACL
MNRILFISSKHTGGGHQSIIKALSQQLLLLSPETAFSVIDGFELGHGFLRFSSRSYDSFAIKFPALWGLIYQLSTPFKPLVNLFIARSIRKSLLKQIHIFHPDIIVSVHNLFVGSVIHILRQEGLDIPVISLIADLDHVTSLWADKRAKYILCPTEESRQRMLKAGMAKDQLILTGFPVRREFCDLNPDTPFHRPLKDRKDLSVLLISGSQGSAQVIRIARTLLRNQNIRITIIAGHNAHLKKTMEKALYSSSAGNRVTIYGFVREMSTRMKEADLLIMRASPNVLMEAVNLCKPVIVTGALRGQEARNPQFVLKYELGFVCKDVDRLPNIISALMKNHGEQLKRLAEHQYRFRKPESARRITERLIQTASEAHTSRSLPIA